MAMLAEPKRKQKWTLNPRGKNWSEDQNKFGQKMLERMGWSSGKGLGAQEQGMTDHVRVKFKDDQAGIGFSKDNYDKNWIENQSGFSDLLLQLQQQNGETVEKESEDPKGLSGKSLVSKSESSRKRVHYTKFTRGKDVNRYNPKDLANILGKKDIQEKYTTVKEEPEAEEVVLDPVGTVDRRGGVLTIKGGNIHDYFKNKMFPVASSPVVKRERCESESDSEVRAGFGFNSSEQTVEKMNINIEEEPQEIQHFQIKVEPCETENFKMEKETYENENLATNSNIEKPKKEKKSKKEKPKESVVIRTEFAFENPCLMSVDQIDMSDEKGETPKSPKKSKKDKKKKKNAEDKLVEVKTEVSIIVEVPDAKKTEDSSDSLDSKKSKKEKRVKNKEEETEVKAEGFVFDNPCLMDVHQIDNEATTTSKRKRKQKRDNLLTPQKEIILETIAEVDNEVEAPSPPLPPAEGTPAKKKKKSKSKKENESLDEITESSCPIKVKSEFAFENPCLMDVVQIDVEEISLTKESDETEVTIECEIPRKKKKENKLKQENAFAFENPGLMDVTEIDAQAETQKKRKSDQVEEILEVETPKKKKEKKIKDEMEFAFENRGLMDVTEIDAEAKAPKKSKSDQVVEVVEVETPKKKKKKVKKEREEAAGGFENPCLMDVNQIDNIGIENTEVNIEVESPVEKKSKKTKSKSNSCEYAFENPCLEDLSKIDEKVKKPKRSRINKENISDAEIVDNSKNEELEEKSNFAFQNPCLGDVQVIDIEAQISKKRKRKHAEVPVEVADKPGKPKRAKESEDRADENEDGAGREFEVPRKHFGLVNTGLDLTDETPGKKRVTFNDKVEFNTDVEQNKESRTKLDRYEVSAMSKRNKSIQQKLLHTKKELREFFVRNPVLLFKGGNVNELKGYGN